MEAIIAIAAITLCIILRFWLGIILVLVILFMTGCSTVQVTQTCPLGDAGLECRKARVMFCIADVEQCNRSEYCMETKPSMCQQYLYETLDDYNSYEPQPAKELQQ